jgi:hypothetical protein
MKKRIYAKAKMALKAHPVKEIVGGGGTVSAVAKRSLSMRFMGGGTVSAWKTFQIHIAWWKTEAPHKKTVQSKKIM